MNHDPHAIARLIFTPRAFVKMNTLVANCSTEIAWHGLVQKVNEHTFRVYDILCFPQYAGAAVTTTSQKEYQRWLFEQPQQAPINLHGHSHVNMPAFSSGRDDAYQCDMLETLGPQDFYIFHITNKRGESWILIRNNAINRTWLLENNEIELSVEGLYDFVCTALDQVRPLSQLPPEEQPPHPEEWEEAGTPSQPPPPESAAGFTMIQDEDYDDDWLHLEEFSLRDPFARNEA